MYVWVQESAALGRTRSECSQCGCVSAACKRNKERGREKPHASRQFFVARLVSHLSHECRSDICRDLRLLEQIYESKMVLNRVMMGPWTPFPFRLCGNRSRSRRSVCAQHRVRDEDSAAAAAHQRSPWQRNSWPCCAGSRTVMPSSLSCTRSSRSRRARCGPSSTTTSRSYRRS